VTAVPLASSSTRPEKYSRLDFSDNGLGGIFPILPITPILPISSSGVGLPSAIPEIAPARPPPQMELDYIDIDYDTGA